MNRTLKSAFMTVAGLALLMSSAQVSRAEAYDFDELSKKQSYEKARQFELGPIFGFNYFDDEQNLKDETILGGRLGYNFTKHYGLEFSIEKINSRVDNKLLTGLKTGRFESPIDKVDLTLYQLNVIYQFKPEERFTPFVLAGIGSANYSPNISDGNMATINLGVGAKYWLRRNIALRIDIKDTIISEVFDNSFHNYSATIELVYAFGQSSAPIKKQPVPEKKEVIVVSEVSPKVEEKVLDLSSYMEEEKVIVLAFEDVHFNFDKSTLTEGAKIILRRSIQILRDNPQAKVRIAGYTSASGTNAYNQRLSERRASAVEEYLINEGIVAPDRLSTLGYGETRPAEYEAAPKKLYSKAAMANMRVLFETVVN